MEKYSYINNAHPQYIEEMYQKFKKNPDSVDESWRTFFEGFEYGHNGQALTEEDYKTADQSVLTTKQALKELHVFNLIDSYRARGHLFTKTNPVRKRRDYSPSLDLENFELSEKDLDTTFYAGTQIGLGPAKLLDIIDHLKETYCKSIGAEYMFIRIPEKQKWLQQRMETTRNRPDLTIDEKRRILHKLNEAVVFEKFLHTKYVGQKRFSLQGGETLIPALDTIVEYGAEIGLQELLIGMAHRGRLNILANILKKKYEEIFSAFEGEEHADAVFSGDVKYHLGYTSLVKTKKGKEVKVGLAPNPSHLEVVNPIVAGMVKAKLDHEYKGDENKIAPIMIHGDAAIAGQGVVYELIQMSLLNGYRTGGTIHIVVNNQLGFTTNYLQGRSSTYCTDVAKVTLSPVFHVNADDAEAVVQAMKIALEYRQKFHTDVFIDLLGYRRYGHNEGDEPRFTQPKLYSTIAKHSDPREIYKKKLLEKETIEKEMAREMEKEFKSMLQERFEIVKSEDFVAPEWGNSEMKDQCDQRKRFHDHDFEPIPNTKFPQKRLLELGKKIFSLPENFNLFNKMRKIYEERMKNFEEGKELDWAIAEFLAYATILDEGVPIRISGQDSERGTFSHRHSTIRDEKTEDLYIPLNNVSDQQGQFRIFNSLLSEFGEMGFEYGYACATPHGLTIWEAQFGDFFNAAQVIIDQFLSSSEVKWHRSNGLVLYLPHGYEGQGPEHSSARIERFLQLSSRENWRVTNVSTPANFFHLLRSQVKYPFRAPLVIFTPKSLLRHPKCVSSLDDLVKGAFKTVLDDPDADNKKIKKVLICSGKIYYDLLEFKEKYDRKDVAIVRIEQLYPFPKKEIDKVINRYKNASLAWVQEEPENNGPWPSFKELFERPKMNYFARRHSPAPATGFYKTHQAEQNEIIMKAFS